MSFIDDFNRELDTILLKRDEVAKAFSLELHGAVVEATPEDTGALKQAWQWSPVAIGHYRSSNNLSYAIIIDGGRRFVGNKEVGSERLKDGWKPIIEREEETLQTMLKDIK